MGTLWENIISESIKYLPKIYTVYTTWKCVIYGQSKVLSIYGEKKEWK